LRTIQQALAEEFCIQYALYASISILAPWSLLYILFFLVAIWIIFQPMDMRGTMMSLPVAVASQAIRPALPAVIPKETPRKVAPGKHAWLLPSCALNKSATLTGIPAKLESRRKPAFLWRTCANPQQRCLAA
jgi:hypothetical protein